MKPSRIAQRRSGLDRRLGRASTYTELKRRKLQHRRHGIDRRCLIPIVCVFCSEVCGDGSARHQGAATLETLFKFRNGICADCVSEKFPEFDTDVI